MSDGTDHTLHREFKERRIYSVEIVAGELKTTYGNSQYVDAEPLKTIECSCGERFIKEQKAIDHIQSIEPGNESSEEGVHDV